jgi:hypothetical protein
MKREMVLTIICVFLSAISLFGQDKEPKIWIVESKANMTATVEGLLKDGVKLSSLDWASSSSIACFPATQNAKFNGNHVFFSTVIPPRSIMTITVKPKDASKNLSLYAYEIAANETILPEALQSCVTCEADYKWDYPKKGRMQNETRTVTLNAIQNPYKVIIGVAGADGLTDADFTLEISLKQ